MGEYEGARMQRGWYRRSDALVGEVRAAAVGGDPLDESTRDRLERSFNIDLSVIRVHADSVADHLTRSFHTDAFAAGPHVFFRTGAYDPRTEAGLSLLAHEVTHTLQQACRTSNRSLSDLGQEVEADQVAACVAGERQVQLHSRPTCLTDGLADGPLVIQRHESFWHRALGDLSVADINTLATRDANLNAVIDRETELMWLWRQNPEQVSEADVSSVCPGLQTLRLQPSGLLVTYGELTALPDYIPNFLHYQGCPKDVLLPILQSMREESYNRLNAIRGKNTAVRFAGALFGAAGWPVGLLSKLFNSWGLDVVTRGLGTKHQEMWDIEHYLGQLARNACHFAPYSWYRWRSAYLTARDLAKQASNRWLYPDERMRLTNWAWLYHGYAQHFLHDAFAAGHLLNKTLVMQWFVQWAPTSNLFVEEWDELKYFNVTQQPQLAGWPLYDASYLQQQGAGWPPYSSPSYTGPAVDPQTAEEAGSYSYRVALSGVQAYERIYDDKRIVDQDTAYQHYLTFLSSVITQAASGAVHDALNAQGIWVASEADPMSYQVFGDVGFVGSPEGARITAEMAQASRQSIIDLLTTGETPITTEQLRQRFPSRAGDSPSTVIPLEAWAANQQQWAIDAVFTSSWVVDRREQTVSFSRIANVSRDRRVTESASSEAWMEQVLGEIRWFPYNFVPVDWAACDGALLSIEDNAALYSLLGIAFGGDGLTHFALPNLAQSVPFANQGQGTYCMAIRGLYPQRP